MIGKQVWIKNNLDSDALDYDYDIEEKDGVVELKYSVSSDWSNSVAGEICAKLEDDGDGIKIIVGGKKIKMTYNELREVKCLLLYENDEHIEIRETKTTKMIK